MTIENSSTKRYWYSRFEGYESRSQHRLQNALGVNEAAAEAILRLGSQVLELKAQVHQLEIELASQADSQDIRLARYRDFYYEASWIELEIPE